ncbi:MAG: nucleotide sugar-phosphate transferase [Frankiales bacterium]|nr:nucleotide sugar-phosphate transferase [Frankiales bacterium]
MIGIVLVAGAGRRLRPLTDDIPKALLPIDDDRLLFESALAAFQHVGVTEAVLVTGYAAHRVDEVVPRLAERYNLRINTIYNDRARDWNNCYSLWLARDALSGGALVVNGDTWHPWTVERTLLDSLGDVRLAIDTVKVLADEEMKVQVGEGRRLARINKALDPATAYGEYIGVSYIGAAAADGIAAALEETWRRDPTLYYEDGFQTYVDGGGVVDTAAIGVVTWTEVDNEQDLALARSIAAASRG